MPRVVRGRAGSRAWCRRAAARLTGRARLSTPMTELRRQAMTLGLVPVRTWEASSAKDGHKRGCGEGRTQALEDTRRGAFADHAHPPQRQWPPSTLRLRNNRGDGGDI